MNVDKFAQSLVKGGIIDAPTAAKMVSRCRNLNFYDLLIGVSLASVLLSLVVIVIAKWDQIPVGVKIGVPAALNGVVAFTLFRFARKPGEKKIWFGHLILLLAILTLIFIALVEQIYHTHSSIWNILTFWLALTLPFCVGLAQNQHKTRLWILSFLASCSSFISKRLHSAIAKVLPAKIAPITNSVSNPLPSSNLASVFPLKENTIKTLRPIFLAACLALPLFGVLALATERHSSRPVIAAVRLPVVGYYQKNPMFGNYLRFRFDGPDAPDGAAHDYFISEATDELIRLILHPIGHTLTIGVVLSGNQVKSYDMLYIDDQPWHDFLENQKEQCRINMGKEC